MACPDVLPPLDPYEEDAAPRSSRPPSLLEELFPGSEFQSAVALRVDAEPEEVFRALAEVTLDDMPLAHALGVLRYLPGRIAGSAPPEPPSSAPFLEQLLHGGSVILGERDGRELVLGSIGKFHQPLDQEPVPLRDAAAFHAFDDAAYQKLAIAVRVEPLLDGVRVILEHRTHALGDSSRKAFARYWTLIEPFGDLVSWLLLRAVRRRAEAMARARTRGATDA